MNPDLVGGLEANGGLKIFLHLRLDLFLPALEVELATYERIEQKLENFPHPVTPYNRGNTYETIP